MGRRKIYTAEEAKLVKSYRNKIYYYGRQIKSIANSMNMSLSELSFSYSMNITFKDIRNNMDKDDSKENDGLLLDIFLDHYDDTEDFRKIIIEEGTETEYEQGNKLSKRLGYGSLEDYKKVMNAKEKLNEAEEAYESLKIQKQIISTLTTV